MTKDVYLHAVALTMPFAATWQGQHGRVIGRLSDWPKFRPDDGNGDVEISWALAERLQAKENG